jgi:hypothetical protein
MFPDDMIAKKSSIFDGINQKKDKKEDIYVLLFDESLNQQLKKTSWTSKLY